MLRWVANFWEEPEIGFSCDECAGRFEPLGGTCDWFLLSLAGKRGTIGILIVSLHECVLSFSFYTMSTYTRLYTWN